MAFRANGFTFFLSLLLLSFPLKLMATPSPTTNQWIESLQIKQLKAEITLVVNLLNQEFKGTIKVTYDNWATALYPAYCEPIGNNNQIFFCEIFLKKLLESRSFEDAKQTIRYVATHEYLHNIYDISLDTDSDLLESLSIPNSLKGLKRNSLAYQAQHENLDGLAAKTLRKLILLSEPNLNTLDISSLFSFGMKADEINLRDRIQTVRGQAFLKAFYEGWDSWTGFRKLHTHCTSYREKNDFISEYILRELKTRSRTFHKSCSPYPQRILKKSLMTYLTELDEVELPSPSSL
jgi:hypothetical protein